jgi:mono/diheme cytochrome c family protein
MKPTILVALAFSLATADAATQPTNPPPHGPMMGQGMMGHGMMGPGRGMMGSMVRHHQAMMYGIPEPYRSMRDPLSSTAETLERGAQIYLQNCASCHGASGYGDGPAAKQLVPPPANLAWLGHSRMAGSDQYIYWAVAEGGQPLGTAMPAFKETLPEKDIWAVVTYIRDGLGSTRRP